MRIRIATGCALFVSLAVSGACSSDSPTEPAPPAALQLTVQDGVAVLTQNVVPEGTMQALFEGRVEVHGAGCVRLDTDDAHTVVWPVGYEVRTDGSDRVVLDERGDTLGRLGGDFSLPGGEVVELSDALGFSDADRLLAESRCPGRYWIAG